jgi:Sec-independent protein translocase protein TatA
MGWLATHFFSRFELGVCVAVVVVVFGAKQH